MEFAAGTFTDFCIAGTAFYEYYSGTPTARTGGLTITAGDDNTYSWADANGSLVATNNVSGDSLIRWTAAGGNIVVWDVDSRFTTALCVEWWDNRAWAGNLSSGTKRVWRSDTLDETTWGATAFFTMDTLVTGIKAFDNALAIHTDRTITLLTPTGNAAIPYSVTHKAIPGTVSERGIVTLPTAEQHYIRKDGIYSFSGGTFAEKISSDLDGSRFWDLVFASRIQQAHAVVYHTTNEVWWTIPIDSSADMNATIIYDYLRRIWYGPYEGVTRNCSAIIDDKPHLGGYDNGQAFTHDHTANDNGIAIDAWFSTAALSPISASSEERWEYARHFFDATGGHDISAEQLSPTISSATETFAQGGSFAAIGVFQIGVSAIAGSDNMQFADRQLVGSDPWTRIRYRNANAGEGFTIRRTHLNYSHIGPVRKTG
jgi:hypothetical protein